MSLDDGATDPAAMFLARIAAGDAYEPMVLNWAAHQREHDPGTYERLVVAVKAAGGRATAWEKAVKVAGGPLPKGARPEVPEVPTADAPRTNDWRELLARGRGGVVRNTFRNLCVTLRGAYAGRLAYNAMTLAPELDGLPVEEGALGRLREGLERDHQIEPGADNLVSALRTVAEETTYHPVRRYLDGLVWDGEPRIAGLAEHVLRVAGEHRDLASAMLRAWMIAAVARVRQPGCKVDTALVLVGDQGWLKSTFFRVLGGAWFRDTRIDLRSKDGYLQLRDAWLYEWSELDHVTSQAHAGEIKGFVSSAEDMFRPPYGRAVIRVPRAQVFCGSTNQDQFLSDPTGDRRFWVIRVGGLIADAGGALAVLRDQLWAEAAQAHAAGEAWHLTAAQEAVRHDQAEEHRVTDPWEDLVAAWIAARSPVEIEQPLTGRTILGGALKLEPHQQTQGAANRLGAILRRLGYARRLARVGATVVRTWEPSEKEVA